MYSTIKLSAISGLPTRGPRVWPAGVARTEVKADRKLYYIYLDAKEKLIFWYVKSSPPIYDINLKAPPLEKGWTTLSYIICCHAYDVIANSFFCPSLYILMNKKWYFLQTIGVGVACDSKDKSVINAFIDAFYEVCHPISSAKFSKDLSDLFVAVYSETV